MSIDEQAMMLAVHRPLQIRSEATEDSFHTAFSPPILQFTHKKMCTGAICIFLVGSYQSLNQGLTFWQMGSKVSKRDLRTTSILRLPSMWNMTPRWA